MVQTERSFWEQNKCSIKYGFLFFNWTESVGRKGENADKHFPLFPQRFQKLSLLGV